MATDGRIVKLEVDCSEEVARIVKRAQELTEKGKLAEAVDEMLPVEKKCRVGGDAISAAKLMTAFVDLCVSVQNLNTLSDYMVLFSRRRGQLKQAMTAMIQQACAAVDKFPTKEEQLKLVEIIRQVSAGKIYVEVDRARMTYRLAKMLEKDGKRDEAATALLELQVETYGSMEKREKLEMLLEQMRLCLQREDYVRTQIISRKISSRAFDDADVKDLKIKYHELMIRFHTHEATYKEVCRHYQSLFQLYQDEYNADAIAAAANVAAAANLSNGATADAVMKDVSKSSNTSGKPATNGTSTTAATSTTKAIVPVTITATKEEALAKALESLRFCVLYLILTPFDNEQHDLMHRLKLLTLMEKLPNYVALIDFFIKREVVPLPHIVQPLNEELHQANSPAALVFGSKAAAAAAKGAPVATDDEKVLKQREQRSKDLRSRCIEHNIQIIADYYSRMTLDRLCTVLALPIEEIEQFIGTLVTKKTIFARIDRIDGVVVFRAIRDPVSVLDQWRLQLNQLMNTVSHTTHLISKEEMVHKHMLVPQTATAAPPAVIGAASSTTIVDSS